MRLQWTTLLGLFCLTSESLASQLAGPWQYVFFYYVYKAEFLTEPATSRMVAPNCAPSTGEGPCKFGDFMESTLHYRQRPRFPRGALDTLKPEMPAAVKEIRDIVKAEGLQLVLDQKKIYKTWISNKFQDLLTGMVEVLQKCQGSTDEVVQDAINQAKIALNEVRLARIIDNESYLSWMTAAAEERGFNIVIKNGDTLEGKIWEDIDFDETILSSKDTENTRKNLEELMEQYMQPKDDDPDKFKRSHRRLIVDIQNLQSRLETCG